MAQKESSKSKKVFKHFDGQRFTVRGIRTNYSYGEKNHVLESSASHISNEFFTRTAATRRSFGSLPGKASEALRGKRLSRASFKSRYDQNQLANLVSQHSISTLKKTNSTYWDREDWVVPTKVFNDQYDISQHPSYTIKNVAYNLECEVLYIEAREKYNSQFFRELQHIIRSKEGTSNQYYTRRLFCYTTLWPPLHTQSELEIFKRTFFQLPPAKRKRLDYLMANDLSVV